MFKIMNTLAVCTFAAILAHPHNAQALEVEPLEATLSISTGDNSMVVERETIETRLSIDGKQISTWIGRPADDSLGRAVFTTKDGFTRGTISTKSGTWAVYGGPDGTLTAEVFVPPDRFCGVEENETSEVPQVSTRPAPTESGPVTIDVLTLFSPKAAAIGQGTPGVPTIDLDIEHGIDLANVGMADSDLDVSFNLLGMEPFPEYDEDDPDRSGYSFFVSNPRVAFLREQYQADLVAGVVGRLGPVCGTADGFFNPAPTRGYSLNVRACLSGAVLTHEFGHNLGARHDRENALPVAPPGAPDNGFAHLWCENSDRGNTTIMHTTGTLACAVGTLNQFSNPEILFNGRLTGITGQRDNAAVIRATAPAIAGNRPGPCVPSDTSLCLQGSVIELTATWRTFDGTEGVGHAVPFTSDAGYFWFFTQSNPELMIKVLNGCRANGHRWVFAAGLTNVEVTITATDKATGASETYVNPLSQPFQPIQDILALPCE